MLLKVGVYPMYPDWLPFGTKGAHSQECGEGGSAAQRADNRGGSQMPKVKD